MSRAGAERTAAHLAEESRVALFGAGDQESKHVDSAAVRLMNNTAGHSCFLLSRILFVFEGKLRPLPDVCRLLSYKAV
ncbi:hypothetical protein [Salibacterium qingdaonense]|uniref:hypothetical protein n=1 Tax=Salibacterium qingdaonense TaxID=266892 RepID=UPI000B80C208|nr:hypothetical protein [Salibacterium qingdaonense]